MNDERIKKLPAWAQETIRQKDLRIESLEARVADLSSMHGPKDSPVTWSDYSFADIPLPPRGHLSVRLGEHPLERIEVGLRGGRLHLCGGLGSGIAVHPKASNVVEVSLCK